MQPGGHGKDALVCVCVCEGQTDGEREGDEMGFACQSGDGN